MENAQSILHIDIKYHFIRDQIEQENIELKYVSTQEQVADIFTKGLSYPSFKKFLDKLGIV